MTNLDKILERIHADGEERALALDRAAGEEIERLDSAAAEETAVEEARIAAEAEKDGEKIVTLARSGALALQKKRALEAKSRALDDAVEEALKKLAALPEADYAALVLSLIEKNTDETAGTVYLAAGRPVADRAAFEAALAALPGRKLALAQETCPLATGALVSYGKIALDLSFEALTAEKHDAIRDRLAELIFPAGAKE